MRKHRSHMNGLAVLLAALFTLGASGAVGVLNAQEPEKPAPPQGKSAMAKDVQVVLTDFNIAMQKQIPAGETTFKIKNNGKVAHSFEVEGKGLEKKLEANVAPGAETTLSVELQPGTYAVYCPLQDHRDRGMSLQLTVTPPKEPTASNPGR